MFKNIFKNSLSSFAIALLLLISCNPAVDADDAIKQNQKGIELMNAGKFELAIIEFKEAIKNRRLSTEDKGTIYRNIALTYDDLGKTDSSLHYYTIAAKSFEKNSYDYLVNMASVDLLAGRTNKALSKLSKASLMSPNDLSVNNTLGLIYLGEYDDSYTDAEKALVYNKKAFEINEGKATEGILARNYYALENYVLAEMHYENIQKKYPDDPAYSLNMAMVKYKLNKKPEGDLLFEKVVKQDSSYQETIDNFKLNNQ